MKDSVKIINHSGFWGDSQFALKSIFDSNEKFDYLVSDYLSEVTLGLLDKLNKHREVYLRDFIDHLRPFLGEIKKRKIKVITNAGAGDPELLALKLRDVLKELKIDLKVIAISGDKLSDDTYAYTGAFPIAKALELYADIVICGRVVDSAVTLGPLIYEFKINPNQFNLLATGSLAGHLIECGTQVCGGNFSGNENYDLSNTSFPLLTFYRDGVFSVSKLSSMSGEVNRFTISEQLVYEIEDPCFYILPDVICDFSQVCIDDTKDEIIVSNVKGVAPLKTFKTLKIFEEGYRLSAPFVLVGTNLKNRATKIIENILTKIKSDKAIILDDYRIEFIEDEQRLLTVLNISHSDKKILNQIAGEIPAAALSMYPGMISLLGGKAKATSLMKLESGSIDRKRIKIFLHEEDNKFEFSEKINQFTEKITSKEFKCAQVNQGDYVISLRELCYARSGDKGNHANIGLVSKNIKAYEYLKRNLNSEQIKNYFNHNDKVSIYDLPGVYSLNIVLYNFLDGGGLSSLKLDSQGKGLGQEILSLQIKSGEHYEQ